MREMARESRPNRGAYALVLHLPAARRLRIGRLGQLRFAAGYYCYVGSARTGLHARVRRHLRLAGKRVHWHIDYFRPAGRALGVLLWTDETARECELSRTVAGLADSTVAGFGASDCRCAGHLHYFARSPVRLLRRLGLPGTRWLEPETEGGPEGPP
jgi:sugar fermentation stimulation protein A